MLVKDQACEAYLVESVLGLVFRQGLTFIWEDTVCVRRERLGIFLWASTCCNLMTEQIGERQPG